MAYADTNDTNRKLGAGAAVLLLEAGLAWAVIAGLAYHYDRKIDHNPTVTNVPLPKDPPKQPAVKPLDPVKTQTRTETKPPLESYVDTGPSVLPTFSTDDGGGAIREVIFTPPTPPSPPLPRFTPKLARPKGAMANWVTDNDYPTSDLRLGHAGRTAYRLSIDSTGQVTNCTVTGSSGWPGLDKATCDKVTGRARFEPATNGDGERVAGTFSSAVSWRIPPEE